MTETDPLAFRRLKAPTLAEMEVMAEAAFHRLPQRLRALCGNLVVRVEDFPTEEVMQELEAETEFDLLGLFEGVGLAQGYGSQSFSLPNMIHLYRRPILDYWAEHDETLGKIITHVLIHEIGHHVGLSDDDMERIEDEADT